MASANDARCVSWILWNITDPEALDAAIRLAGTIRWFEDGIDIEPPYDLIVSAFHACFGSDRELYPGSRDRAYHSGRTILWIHTLAMCRSEEFASTFPVPPTKYTAPISDPDLAHLLSINQTSFIDARFGALFTTLPELTPSHSQWISNVLLHLSWANRTALDFGYIRERIDTHKTIIPLDAMVNRLLTCSIFLGLSVEGEALKVQDKSYEIPCSYPPSS